jgi:flagellar basal-body rod modification protein FlgD
MNISGVSSSDPVSLSQASSGDALGKDSFMKLLIQQMKNQDPLEPAKNEEMLAQLAQFQNLEEMDELNSNIVGLAVLQQSNALLQQLTSASGLIGKQVEYVDATTGDKHWGVVDSVKIEEGVATLDIDGKSIPLADVVQVGAPPAADPDPISDPNADPIA